MAERSVLGSAVIPLRLVFLMWLFFFLEYNFNLPLSAFGIHPRSLTGLIGIVISPMVHGNIMHLISNTFPLLFLGGVLFYFYPRIAVPVFFRAYLWTNILVWLFARNANHIGASGLIYGIAFFLIFFGLLRRDFMSLLISIVIILLYGGVFYGVLPTDPDISWESHFGGALVGITSAVAFSTKKKIA
jgi:membrane associated rhomboid family serine protease